MRPGPGLLETDGAGGFARKEIAAVPLPDPPGQFALAGQGSGGDELVITETPPPITKDPAAADNPGGRVGVFLSRRTNDPRAPRVGTRPTGGGMMRGGLWVVGSAVLREGMGAAAAHFHFL